MRLTRRNFAQLLGGGAAGTALLPFVPRASRAADGAVPKRLLVIFHGLGYMENAFWPTGTSQTDFTLGEGQAALAPFKDRLIYPDGLSLYGAQYFYIGDYTDDNEHGNGAALTFTASRKQGYATGPSFEQLVADKWQAESARPFRHVGLGVNATTGEHYASFYSAGGQPIVPQNSPSAAFDSLFASLAMDPNDEVALARLRAQRKSVLDVVKGDLAALEQRIGAQENAILEQHLEHLRALEMRLLDVGPSCTPPSAPTADEFDDTATIEAQIDMIVNAFACDLTSVATLQLGHCDGGISMLGLNAHDVSHQLGDTGGAAEVVAQHLEIDKWWADRWLYLLQRLDAVQEENGSLLDNTLVVWGHDTSSGQTLELGPHMHWRMPYFMAGGGNWAFTPGRHLVYPYPPGTSMEDVEASVSHSRLFVSILQRAGVDVDTFGNLDMGSGTLPML